MNIEETTLNDSLILIPAGHLDAKTAHEFQDAVVEKIKAGAKSIVLDFSNIDYLSSAGLRSLLVIAKQQKEGGGHLAICSVKEMVHKVFEVSGFNTIVDIHTDRRSAVDKHS